MASNLLFYGATGSKGSGLKLRSPSHPGLTDQMRRCPTHRDKLCRPTAASSPRDLGIQTRVVLLIRLESRFKILPGSRDPWKGPPRQTVTVHVELILLIAILDYSNTCKETLFSVGIASI